MGALWNEFLIGAAPTSVEFRTAADRLGISTVLDEFQDNSVSELLDSHFDSATMRALFAPTLEGSAQQPGLGVAQGYFQTVRFRDQSYQGVPIGGIGTLADAFVSVARRAGAQLFPSSQVAEITVSDGQANGVLLRSGERHRADVVVSNADPKTTFLRLIGSTSQYPKEHVAIRELPTSPGGGKFHAKLRGTVDLSALRKRLNADLPVGPVSLISDMNWYLIAPEQALRNEYPTAPLIELQLPTLNDRSGLDEDTDAISAWIPHLAPNPPPSWKHHIDRFEHHVLDSIERVLPGTRSQIVESRFISPEELQATVGLTDGNIHHIALTPQTMLAHRPIKGWNQGRTPVGQLYLCGAGTHPGGEVSGVPGLNAAMSILDDRHRAKV